jgi:hypothetical protein
VASPNFPLKLRGLFGANYSSSIGLKTAKFLFLALIKYVPDVPCSVSFGFIPAIIPALIKGKISSSFSCGLW